MAKASVLPSPSNAPRQSRGSWVSNPEASYPPQATDLAPLVDRLAAGPPATEETLPRGCFRETSILGDAANVSGTLCRPEGDSVVSLCRTAWPGLGSPGTLCLSSKDCPRPGQNSRSVAGDAPASPVVVPGPDSAAHQGFELPPQPARGAGAGTEHSVAGPEPQPPLSLAPPRVLTRAHVVVVRSNSAPGQPGTCQATPWTAGSPLTPGGATDPSATASCTLAPAASLQGVDWTPQRASGGAVSAPEDNADRDRVSRQKVTVAPATAPPASQEQSSARHRSSTVIPRMLPGRLPRGSKTHTPPASPLQHDPGCSPCRSSPTRGESSSPLGRSAGAGHGGAAPAEAAARAFPPGLPSPRAAGLKGPSLGGEGSPVGSTKLRTKSASGTPRLRSPRTRASRGCSSTSGRSPVGPKAHGPKNLGERGLGPKSPTSARALRLHKRSSSDNGAMKRPLLLGFKATPVLGFKGFSVAAASTAMPSECKGRQRQGDRGSPGPRKPRSPREGGKEGGEEDAAMPPLKQSFLGIEGVSVPRGAGLDRVVSPAPGKAALSSGTEREGTVVEEQPAAPRSSSLASSSAGHPQAYTGVSCLPVSSSEGHVSSTRLVMGRPPMSPRTEGAGVSSSSAGRADVPPLVGLTVAELVAELKEGGAAAAAAAALRVLSRDGEASAGEVVDAGAIGPLTELVVGEDRAASETATAALLNLTAYKATRDTVVQESAFLQKLTALLETGDEEARRRAAAALGWVSAVEGAKERLLTSGAAKQLVAALAEGSVPVKTQALTCLLSICLKKECRGPLAMTGIVGAACTALGTTPYILDEESSTVLALLSSDPQGRQALLIEGAIPLLAELLEGGSSLSCQKHAVTALLGLATHCKESLQEIYEEGVLPALESLETTESARTKRQVRSLLRLLRKRQELEEGRGGINAL